MIIKLEDFINEPSKQDILSKIRDNFYNLRKSKKISREKLSKISGVDIGVIRRFEEKKYISLENLINLAFALDAKDHLDKIFYVEQPIKIYDK